MMGTSDFSDFRTKNLLQSTCILGRDMELTILDANSGFYQMIGCSKEDLLRRCAAHYSALIDFTVYQKFRKFLDESSDMSMVLEHMIKTSDSELWLHTRVRKMDEEKVILVSRCINRCKEAEKKMEHFKEMDHYIRENLGYAVVEYDIENGIITEMESDNFDMGEMKPGKHFRESITASDIFKKQGIIKFREAAAKMKESGQTTVVDVELKTKAGTYRWVRAYLGHLGPIWETRYLCLFADISAEKETAMQYLEETCFYQSILSDQDAYGHLDITENRILKVGGLWYGYSSIIDKVSFFDLFMEFKDKVVHPDDRDRYQEVMQIDNFLTSFENGITRLGCEFRRIVKQNQMVWMELTIHMFESPLNKHVMALIFIKNADEKHKKRVLLELDHEYDHITGLLSRKAAEKKIIELANCLRDNEVCIMMLLDIDDFANFVYEFGKEEGEHVISRVVKALKQTFRSDDVMGYYGKDEFLIFVKGLSNVDIIKKRIEYISDLLKENYGHDVTISIGAVRVLKGDLFGGMLKKARTALYAAKQTGKNRYVFYEEITALMEEYGVDFTELDESIHEESIVEDMEGSNFDALVGTYGDIAYLINPRNYDLIYGNQAFYRRIGKTGKECEGMKCYEIMHARQTPCPFCRSANWTTERFYMYRNYNIVLEQEFLIKNKLVTWNGHEALLAVAVDLSNDKNIIDSMSNQKEESDCILAGIQSMQEAEDLSNVIEKAMETIGSFYNADAVKFWKQNEDFEGSGYKVSSFYCAANAADRIKQLTENYEDMVSAWLRKRKWREIFVAENQEYMLSNSYDMHVLMKQMNVNSQYWVEWSDSSGIIGFFELDNVRRNAANQSFIRSFISFISNEWKKRSLVDSIAYTNYHDVLTGVMNRNSYENYMNHFQADSMRSMAVVVANINGLKAINAAMGFEGGNNCLKLLSDILKHIFDTNMVFRLNGDEFLVLLPDKNQEFVERCTKKIEAEAREKGNFTVSAGYSWDDIEKELEPLVDYATQVMRQNKQHYYESNGSDGGNTKAEIQENILHAIDSKKMEVYLQPKIDSRTGRLEGAEALVRMHHKDQGIIPPVKFIGMLEKNGLIRYVDLFVFERTLQILEEWRSRGFLCPRISVNFSRVTLMEQDLKSTLDYIMSQYHVPKDRIELEITESYEDVGKAFMYQAARKLHAAGYIIALDDFGTKYTNLSILSDIDVDVLKLDKSLVGALADNKKNRIILQNIIEMCHQLQIEVIAEGVEIQEQEEILREMGCYLIQGYLYSKPIPVKDFEIKFID